ncbi:PIR protein [Plasmodium vivax]|uniref:VIR protein n=1 Tax=Plasmodium vivax TaxID=5855 RepID=A0A565A5M9_PLAVI|nr:PIR protein [Plasmodium vivax]
MEKASYDFCKYMDYYIDMEKWLPNGYQSKEYKNYCELKFNIFPEKNKLEVLCAKFKYFYSLFFFNTFGVNAYRNNENVEYLNFWLNKELENENISSITIPDFYLKLKSDDSSFDSGNKFKKNKCHDYSAECVRKYKDSMEKCSNNKFTKFCNALNTFKEKYKKIDSVPLVVCKGNDILPLSNEEIIQKEKDIDTERFGGAKEQPLAGFPPKSLEIPSQETSVDSMQKGRGDSVQEERGDSVQTGRGDSVQEERGDSVPETLGDTQQPLSLSVEGKRTDNYNRVVSGAGTMLGAFSICMIMYKFSPIGAWLNRRFGRNKNIWENRNEKVTEEILKYYPDPSRMSAQNDKYSMSYSSLKND